MRAIARTCAVVVAVLLTAACGEDSACESYGEALCEAACGCEGEECTIAYDGASLTFENEADCKALYRFACDEPDETYDYEGCEAVLDQGECVEGEFQHPTCDMGDPT